MPSPFAAALLFGYVANYIYDGDAPLAERRAQALVDRSGAAPRAARRGGAARAARRRRASRDVERQLQQLDERYRARVDRRRPRSAAPPRRSDADEIAARCAVRRRQRRSIDLVDATGAHHRRQHRRRARDSFRSSMPARYRDALGVPLPAGSARVAARARPRCRAGSRPALRAHAWAVHDRRARRALRARPRDRRRRC